jgi:hypothetical protein
MTVDRELATAVDLCALVLDEAVMVNVITCRRVPEHCTDEGVIGFTL